MDGRGRQSVGNTIVELTYGPRVAGIVLSLGPHTPTGGAYFLPKLLLLFAKPFIKSLLPKN